MSLPLPRERSHSAERQGYYVGVERRCSMPAGEFAPEESIGEELHEDRGGMTCRSRVQVRVFVQGRVRVRTRNDREFLVGQDWVDVYACIRVDLEPVEPSYMQNSF